MRDLDTTLLDVFCRVSLDNVTAEYDVLQCGDERWTYGDLHIISSGLAIDLGSKYGPRPTVAIVSENHPYYLALMIATWKLGGIVAPIDHHAPPELFKAMLCNMNPTFAVVASSDELAKAIVSDLSIPIHLFGGLDATITALTQRFLHCSSGLPPNLDTPPGPHDISLYIHTSSATSVSNLKCVPLTHESILSGCRGQLEWMERTFPDESFDQLRVLGWAPWTHMMGISRDIGTAVILTHGTYVFATVPSTYPTSAEVQGSSLDRGTDQQLLRTILKEAPTFVAGVPLLIDQIRQAWTSEVDPIQRYRMSDALRKIKLFSSSGALTNLGNIEWANDIGLRLVLGMGMTEMGGPLFHARSNEGQLGWSIKDCNIPDALFSLANEHGEECADEGELWIKSKLIARRYLNPEQKSPFSLDSEGYITFRTGDIYSRTSDDRLVWKGRKEDFIQMVSGEILDPRILEMTLNSSAAIAQTCVVGNNFIRAPADFVCLIVEPIADAIGTSEALKKEVTRAVASVNRTLAPPLRISWRRVLILSEGQRIPFTKKGAVFRKKLESLFGVGMNFLIHGTPIKITDASAREPALNSSASFTEAEVKSVVTDAVSEAFRYSINFSDEYAGTTFAELGMDSAMATMIVNKLNQRLHLALPLSTCHSHVDLASLSQHVIDRLGISRSPTDASTSTRNSRISDDEDIAIVGQAMRLPGGIDTVDSFWQALVDKRTDLLVPIPPERWDHSSFYRPASSLHHQVGDITFEKSGFVELDGFDNAFFGITSAEAMCVTPTVRLTLEAAFEALEDANIPISRVKGSSMGVFVANGIDEGYKERLFLSHGWETFNRFYGTGVANSTACGRISYLLDLHGPSVTLDTACSGGLVALDYAVKHVRSGGDSALAIGVNVHLWPGTFSFLSAQNMSSPTSRCATFTNEADGYAPSEGVVALVLKTRSAALRDNDNILGFIKATDIQHNGRTQGLVAPSATAQSALHRTLLCKSSLSASDIDLIEAHGTGTTIGDSMEIQGINEVFKESHSTARPLIIGAAKSCFGHTESSAGLVGIVKTLVSFRRGIMPGLTHLTKNNLNPEIDCSVVPILIPEHATKLSDHAGPYRALVLAYGFAGTIAGAVLESSPIAPQTASDSQTVASSLMIFVVSAKTQNALVAYIHSYIEHCSQAPPSDFHSICYTSCVGREHYRHRFACVVRDTDDLICRLQERLTKIPPATLSNPQLVLGFPGQGNQYLGMSGGLALRYPGFRAIITEAANAAAARTGFPVLSFLLGSDTHYERKIDESEVAQVCIFIHQYSISRWLNSLGLHPASVIGHSIGEIAAAVNSGVLTFDFALDFVIMRAQILSPASQQADAGMVAIAATEAVISQYIHDLGLEHLIVIAVFNDSNSHVVSGDLNAVKHLTDVVKSRGIRASQLNVDQGFHSPCIEHSLPKLATWMNDRYPKDASVKLPYFSTALGDRLPKGTMMPSQYWVDHARNPVKFVQAAEKMATDRKLSVVIDVGPQRSLWASLQTRTQSDKVVVGLSAKQGHDQNLAFLEALATIFEHNLQIDFSRLFEGIPELTTTRIPTYPFQRQRYFPPYIPSRRLPIVYQSSIRSEQLPIEERLYRFLEDHQIEAQRIVPGAALVEFVARSLQNTTRSLKEIRFHRRLVVEETLRLPVELQLSEDGSFIISQDKSTTGDEKVASGLIDLCPAVYASKTFPATESPAHILQGVEIYKAFENVHFGPLFQNIDTLRIWDDHADGVITVEPSQYPEFDHIRKLDPCLHMLGPLGSLGPHLKGVPHAQITHGAFLPASLEGFRLYVDSLPESFICRYHLPLNVERNHLVISSQFEVLSHTGQLLASCEKYSVAWIPTGSAPVMSNANPHNQTLWLDNTWTTSPSFEFPEPPRTPTPLFDTLLYFGIAVDDGDHMRQISTLAARATFVGMTPLGDQVVHEKHPLLSFSTVKADPARFFETLAGKDVTLILDMTTSPTPDSATFTSLWSDALSLMKMSMNGKVKFTNFIVISTDSVPLKSTSHPEIAHPGSPSPVSTVGAVVQGMLRVFRRETGLDDIVWSLDLPSSSSAALIVEVVRREMTARRSGNVKDRTVTYRESQSKGVIRFAPVLQSLESAEPPRMSGIAIIVGMGSIGVALCSQLIAAGCSTVIFVGRRSEDHETVVQELSVWKTTTSTPIAYFQADVCDSDGLRRVLDQISSRYGDVTHIVHTAGIVSDATIAAVNPEAFDRVLRPKVLGAWNLHRLSVELDLKLETFAMFSSISVPLSNAGQVAYVGANSFLDSLATYRQSLGLPGVSLQIGAWESKMIENVDMSGSLVLPLSNSEGMPLIMKALSVASRSPVQVIAKLDLQILSKTPFFAKDPMFRDLLSSASIVQDELVAKAAMSREEVAGVVVASLRKVLELRKEETLDTEESLTSCGVDSIAFTQVKGMVLRDLGVEVPMVYLSDSFKISDMISNVCDQVLGDGSS